MLWDTITQAGIPGHRDSVRGLVCVMRQTEAEGLVRRENKSTGICEGSPHLSIRPKVVFSGRSWDLVPWSLHTHLAQDSGVLEKEMRKELEDSRTLAIACYCCWTAVLQKVAWPLIDQDQRDCDHFHPQDLHKIRPVDAPP